MKTASLILFLAFALTSNAATITAVQNGNWTTASTWDLNRAPADGDIVVIPAGISVMFTNTPYPQNNPVARPTFRINIYGTLDFSSPGNDKMYLDAGSVIQIYAGGQIQTTTSSTEIIAIYNGVVDNTVWTGTPSTVNGPAYANSSTLGFVSGVLPILIESFSIMAIGHSEALLKWTTSMERNSSHFNIEYYDKKSWRVTGTVRASGNSNIPVNYSFTADLHEGENQFRLKEVDIDNKYIYSKIVSVNFEGTAQPRILYNTFNRSLAVNNVTDADIKLFDLSGRQMLSAHYTGEAIRISSTLTKGIYIARASTLQGLIVEKLSIH